VKPLIIPDRPYPFSFSLSSTLHQFLSPANSMAPSIVSTPETVGYFVGCACRCRFSWRKESSRGAQGEANLGFSPYSSSFESAMPCSSPTISSFAEGLIIFLVSLRVLRTHYSSLASPVAPFQGLAGVRRRSTWLPVMLRRVSRQTTATIMFSRTWGSRKVYSRIPGGQKSASPSCPASPALSRR
jgi:hypothetical protein